MLNPSFNDVIQFLPPDYSTATNRALYQTFVRTFGTSVATSMVLGGAIELQSQFSTALTDDGYTQETLSEKIKSDFQRGLGICGTPAPADPTYTCVNCNARVKDPGGLHVNYNASAGMFV